MKITREVNGQVMEFELTSDELFSAYREQEAEFDKQDVINELEIYDSEETGREDFLGKYGVPFDKVWNNEELIEGIAAEKRRNMDKYGMEWTYALHDAMNTELARYKEELQKDVDLDKTASVNKVVSLDQVSLNMNSDVLEIYVGDRLAATVSDGRMDKELALDVLEGLGYKIVEDNSLESKIASAEKVKADAENQEVEMSYGEMTKFFRSVEKNQYQQHVIGCVVFSQDSFTVPYTEEQRTYVISSDNKAFRPNMGGYSVYGSSLDGSDVCVRLEGYMKDEKGGKDGWIIERCYMKKDQLDKGNKVIEALNKEEVR